MKLRVRQAVTMAVGAAALSVLAMAPAIASASPAPTANHHITVQVLKRVLPTPESAYGCNSDVCIYVNGSGNWVNYVDAYAYPPAYVCSHAKLYKNNALYKSGPTICINGPSQYGVTYFPIDRNFSYGTVLCVEWTNISGRPCETVE